MISRRWKRKYPFFNVTALSAEQLLPIGGFESLPAKAVCLGPGPQVKWLLRTAEINSRTTSGMYSVASILHISNVLTLLVGFLAR